MASHVIKVCVFCLICATHTPCGSHAAVVHEHPQFYNFHRLGNHAIIKKEKFKEKDVWENSLVKSSHDNSMHVINKRSSNHHLEKVNSKDVYLTNFFAKFGDGAKLSLKDFRNLLDHLINLQDQLVNRTEAYNETCIIKKALINLISANTSDFANLTGLEVACPTFDSDIIIGKCVDQVRERNSNRKEAVHLPSVSTWLYSLGAVLVISACGILSLLIIPVMQKKFYKPLLQFLVALAVGTLAGDALLHLLPHAMNGGYHSDVHEESHENMWKGFVAMLGLILFFFMERIIPLVHRWRKGKPKEGHSHVKVLNTGIDINNSENTQCKDRYNAYSRCYKDIVDDPNTTFLEQEETSNALLNSRKKNCLKQKTTFDKTTHNLLNNDCINMQKENAETNQNSMECLNSINTSNDCTEVNKIFPHIEENSHQSESEGHYTVILTEHGATHHGHSHLHGHVHAAPQNFSSVAWMVIMGDGLHNFTDGMAIGAAFSGSLAGGFSTAVAVFCHELPHEIGDFAMLLKAGMTIKQALFYNVISSVLCILGNLLGVWLGNTETASSWVFAVAAGTFIYIALVDMIPELSSAHEDEGDLIQCILHLSGLILGFGIMTVMALYEHDLKNMFKD